MSTSPDEERYFPTPRTNTLGARITHAAIGTAEQDYLVTPNSICERHSRYVHKRPTLDRTASLSTTSRFDGDNTTSPTSYPLNKQVDLDAEDITKGEYDYDPLWEVVRSQLEGPDRPDSTPKFQRMAPKRSPSTSLPGSPQKTKTKRSDKGLPNPMLPPTLPSSPTAGSPTSVAGSVNTFSSTGTKTQSGDSLSRQSVSKQKAILNAYGIDIAGSGRSMVSAFTHFDTQKPPDNMTRTEWYQEKYKHAPCDMWSELPVNEKLLKRVAKIFKTAIYDDQVNEAKLTALLSEFIFRDDKIKPDESGENGTKRVMHQMVTVTQAEHVGTLRIPPRVDPLGPSFSFACHSDFTYFNTTAAISEKYRSYTKYYFPVAEKRSTTLPYLTVEVKKDTKDRGVAERQMVAFTAPQLNTRLAFYHMTRKNLGKPVSNDHWARFSYYGMTVCASEAKLFKCDPKPLNSQGEWTGMTAKWLSTFDITDPSQLKRLADWFNEIVSFGLGVVLTDFQRDLALTIHQSDGGEDTEILTLDEVAKYSDDRAFPRDIRHDTPASS